MEDELASLRLELILRKTGLNDLAERARAGIYDPNFSTRRDSRRALLDDLWRAGSVEALDLRARVADSEFG
jgi:hypothetical protein